MKDYDFENKKNQWIGAAFLAIGGVLATTVLVVTIVFFSVYNGLVDAREDVNLAEANVETMMQRRLELIPDLVEVVKSCAKHEEDIFANIAAAESALSASLGSGNPDEITQANNELSKQINNLIVFARDYPTVTAGEQYTTLMGQLEGSVNRITIAREEYNEKVSNYNREVEKAPACFIAQAFGFKTREAFAADKEAEKMNLVDMGLDD